MDRRRRDKKAPPQGVLLQMRLNEVNDLYDQVVGVMDGCPEVLRLELESDARSNEYVVSLCSSSFRDHNRERRDGVDGGREGDPRRMRTGIRTVRLEQRFRC